MTWGIQYLILSFFLSAFSLGTEWGLPFALLLEILFPTQDGAGTQATVFLIGGRGGRRGGQATSTNFLISQRIPVCLDGEA